MSKLLTIVLIVFAFLIHAKDEVILKQQSKINTLTNKVKVLQNTEFTIAYANEQIKSMNKKVIKLPNL